MFQADRLCLAQKEESLPDFFLKFGLHTKLITDVTEFNKKMKSASWLFKKYRGLPSEDRQLMGKGKSRIRNKPLKHNRLPQKSRRRSDNAYVVRLLYFIENLSKQRSKIHSYSKYAFACEG